MSKQIPSYIPAYIAFWVVANFAFAYQATSTKLVNPTTGFGVWQFEFLKPAVVTIFISLGMGFIVWQKLKSEVFFKRNFLAKAACLSVLFLLLPGVTAASIVMSSNYGLSTHSMGCSD